MHLEHQALFKEGISQPSVSSLLLCAIGMGAFLAWTVGNRYTNQLAGFGADTSAHMLDIVVGIGFNVAVLLVAAIFAHRVGDLVEYRQARVMAGLLAIAGPAVVVLCRQVADVPLFVAGSAMKGVASALLFLMWNEFFCRLGMRGASICYAGAYLISVVLQAVTAELPCEAALAVMLACAALSAVTLWPANYALARPGDKQDEFPCAFPWRLVAMVTAFTFVAFFSHQLLGEGLAWFGWLGGGLVAAICLIGSLFFFQRRFDASVFEHVSMPLIVAGLLLFCWRGWDARGAALFFVDAGNVAFRIFLLVVLCDICYRYGIRALWLFPIARIPMMLAEGCGLVLSVGAPAAGVDLLDISGIPLFYGMILLLIVVCSPIRRNARLTDISSGLVSVDASSDIGCEQSPEAILWKASKLARLYGLTHREEEVLSCLAEGMNRIQIQERLVLSENTVRTHMRHLYAKLGIHSKEEAVQMVERA